MKKSKLVEEFTKGWSHFCNHINFADSNLDAESIQFMNEMPGRICTSHDGLVGALESVERYNKAAKEGRVSNDEGHDYWEVVMDDVKQALAQAKTQ